ncbi:UNVERIFIED_CONTAM: hypothetical protein PYX00_003641 [Menopon gallinae]|uniref:Fucosyltransferase n=1 Tax=Menopon gallinae TaxID=328185 RepID=A0AAW2I0P4_9NEOP
MTIPKIDNGIANRENTRCWEVIVLSSQMSLRRRIFYLLIVTGFLFLIVNIHQKAIWAHTFQTDLEILPGKKISPSNLRKSKGFFGKLYWESEDDSTRTEDGNLVNDYTDQQREKTDSSPADLQKPWFLKDGVRRPTPARINKKTGKRLARLWPHEDWHDDRIVNQLMFVPPQQQKKQTKPKKLKKILFYFGLGSWNLKPGRDVFINSKCPVDTCTVTASQADAPTADAILYKDRFVHPGHIRPPRQVWILYFLECPYHTQHIKYNDVINWTATYRRDSDIVAPYERWMYYDPKVKQKPVMERNYAANKTKSVAWFVSNCAARNNRLQYANELKKHIPVDIYGACGSKNCPRFPTDSKEKCFQMLDKDYKFYLAFENSNCRDYITEKFFVNGLGRDILPIVMGAHPEDYARSAPEHSYIHVDDFASPKELAAYLHKLDRDDDLYNSYFRWKGTGEFINTYFFCRLCAMLHDEYPAKSYRDINDWWRGPGVCTQHSWSEVQTDN